MNVALLASGKGSNVDNLLSYFSKNQKVNIVLVGSNNNESGALKHALNHKVSTFIFSKKDLDNSNILLETLENNQIELLVLAGFMLKIPSGFIKSFNGSIVNVHPSLLPKYGGKGMYGDHVHRKVLENKETQTGITFHYVNENYDEGKIIAQFPINLSDNETVLTLRQKINKLEWTKFPLIVEALINE